MPGSPATGGRGVKRRSCCEQAGVRVATNLLEGEATGASEPPDEPPAEGGTSRPGEQSWGPGEQGAPAKSSRWSGEDKSEASWRAPSSQQGKSSRRSIHPGCPPPSSRSNTESRAALGQRIQGSHEEEGPAGRDTSSKRSRKTWCSPKLRSCARTGQSSERRGRLAGPNTKRISEKIGQKQISSLPPGVYDVFGPFVP